MPLPSERPRPARGMLVSAGQRINTRKQDSDYIKRSEMPWQRQALALYDSVPELHFAGQFYARMLSKVRLFAAVRQPGSEHPTPIKDDQELPVQLLERIQDPGGGYSQLLFDYGQLMFITGDGYLLGKGLSNGRGSWSFVWREEVKFDNGIVTHLALPNIAPTEYEDIPAEAFSPVRPGSAVAYRMWTRHPRWRGWPDSPMRAALEIGEELLILSKSVYSTATSRLSRAPMLLMPMEMMPPPLEADGDEDPDSDPFQSDFQEYLEYAHQNPASPEATAPFVLYAAYDYLDRIRSVSLHDPQTDYMERDLRAEAIKRLGYSLDLPPEVLTGFAQANHWASAVIMDAIWSDHGDPKMKQFCHDLSEMYLRPALEMENYPDWENICIWYDATDVVINPDRSDDANEAWDRGAIGYEGYRKMKSIPESYKQTSAEHLEWLETKLVRIRETQDKPSQAERNPAQGPPGSADDSNVSDIKEGKKAVSASGREIGAAELALLRCREIAGIRLRRLKNCPSCLEAAAGQPAAMVASLVGPDGVQQLGVTNTKELVESGADQFRALLSSWGYSPLAAEMLSQMVETHASRTLFEQQLPAMPAGFAAQVERIKEDL